jgi:hypothetical protein
MSKSLVYKHFCNFLGFHFNLCSLTTTNNQQPTPFDLNKTSVHNAALQLHQAPKLVSPPPLRVQTTSKMCKDIRPYYSTCGCPEGWHVIGCWFQDLIECSPKDCDYYELIQTRIEGRCPDHYQLNEERINRRKRERYHRARREQLDRYLINRNH